MRFFDLRRLYTDWDEGLRGKECILSNSVDAIIDCVEDCVDPPPFSMVDSDEARVVTAEPHDNANDDYPFYADEDMNGWSEVYKYCYVLEG